MINIINRIQFRFIPTVLLLSGLLFCGCTGQAVSNDESTEASEASKSETEKNDATANSVENNSVEKNEGDNVDTGLQRGDEVSAFEPVHLTGPETGTRNCPVCTHLEKPVVLVFCKWNKNAEDLAFELDQLVQDNMEHGLKTFMIVTEGNDESIQQFSQNFTLMNVSICKLEPDSLEDDLAKYKFKRDLENTVIVYRDFTVWSNHQNLQAGDFEDVINSLKELFQQPRKKVNQDLINSATAGKSLPQASSDPGSLAISGESAKITFAGSSGDSSQAGHFEQISGSLNCPTDNPEDISFQIDIDMNSIKTEFDLLTKHLKSDEFFDVEKFPTAKFKTSKITRDETSGDFNITGEMTIHGVSNQLTVPAKIKLDENQVSIDAKFDIRQSEFGMNEESSEIVDEVPVTVTIVLDRSNDK